ncbi:MAG: MFS transporter [Lewinella sp.]|nr:MFS transporter [Lewinella sp.]
MKITLRIQLSLMMFLQFCVWGAWYGQMSKYMTNQLAASGDQVGRAYAVFSIATIAAPFFIGMLADRFFSAQRVLGVLNLLGAATLFWLIQVKDPGMFIWVMLLYSLTFAPTIALTSSIAMQNMANPEKNFPSVRVFGTIAWIFITNLVGLMNVGDTAGIFQISMISAAAIGVFSFFLPDTPPTAKGPATFAQIIGKDAFVLFKDRSFAIFFLSSIAICIPLSFYYTWANPSLTDSYIAAFPDQDPTTFKIENMMSLGQVAEVVFMLLLPFAFKRYGVKNILIFGLLAWILRFIFFGVGDAGSSAWMLYTAILLHGICYDFFFVTGMIYTDQKAGPRIKSQAQGLITLATYGVGMFIGSILAGWAKDYYTTGGTTNWLGLWMAPAAIAGVVLVLFLLLFRDRKPAEAGA